MGVSNLKINFGFMLDRSTRRTMPVRRPRRDYKNIIKINIKRIKSEDVDWIRVVKDKV